MCYNIATLVATIYAVTIYLLPYRFIRKRATAIVTYLSRDLSQGPWDQQPTKLPNYPEEGKEIASQTEGLSSPKIFSPPAKTLIRA